MVAVTGIMLQGISLKVKIIGQARISKQILISLQSHLHCSDSECHFMAH